MTLIHGTGLYFEGYGILLTGPSGSGKSDLALRLMARGAELVGDDYLELSRDNGRLIMQAPKNIAGKIEVRHVGILKVAYRKQAPVDLVFQLAAKDNLERLPDRKVILLEGIEISCLDFQAFEFSAVEKIAAALRILL